jgi:hypothetical protein
MLACAVEESAFSVVSVYIHLRVRTGSGKMP